MMTEEDFIGFRCPHCGNAVDYPREFAGTVQGCPGCTENVIVPEQDGQPARPLPLPIETPRLLLRRLSPKDWKDVLEFLSNEDLFRYDPGMPLDEERVCAWLEADQETRLAAGQPLYLGIVWRETGKVVGVVGLQFEDASHRIASFWVRVHPEYQRKGIGTEALAGLMKFGFEGIGLHRLTAFCDSRNTAAIRMLEKAGLRWEGEFLQDRFVKGEWVNTRYYARLRHEPGA